MVLGVTFAVRVPRVTILVFVSCGNGFAGSFAIPGPSIGATGSAGYSLSPTEIPGSQPPTIRRTFRSTAASPDLCNMRWPVADHRSVLSQRDAVAQWRAHFASAATSF